MTNTAVVEKNGLQATQREPLNEARILAAAMSLVDREGIEALSMRRLGKELGVKGMSLYNHVPNKSALLFGLINKMFAEIAATDGTDPSWQNQMRVIMRSFREVGLCHPNVFLVYASRSWDAVRGTRREMDHPFLIHAGFSEEQASYGMRALTSFALGFVAREVEGLITDRDGTGENNPLEGSPNAATRITLEESSRAFDFGLDLILTGMEACLEHPKKALSS